MGRRDTFLLVAGMACACGSRKGMQLDVTGVDGATDVVVIVANYQCNGSAFTCYDGDTSPIGSVGSGISWGSAMDPLPGRIHEVMSTTTSTVYGKTVTFLLEPADLPPMLGHIVVIAEDGSATPLAMSVISGVTPVNNEYISVTLQPVVQYPTTSNQQAIHTWPQGTNSCIAWFSDGSDTDADFFVPPDDHDCDGHLVGSGSGSAYGEECDDYWADYSMPMGGPCATHDPTSTTYPDACLLGTFNGCSDGSTIPPQGCIPTKDDTVVSCVPDAVCECDPLDASCFTNALVTAATQTVPQITCTFQYTTPGGAPTLCTAPEVTSLVAYPYMGSAQFELHDRMLPPGPVANRVGPGDTPEVFMVGSATFELDSAAGTGSSSDAVISFDPTAGNNPNLGAAVFSSSGSYLLGIVDATTNAETLVPLTIGFANVTECGSDSSSCDMTQLDPTDNEWSCVAP